MINFKEINYTVDSDALFQTAFLLVLALILNVIASKFIDVAFDKFRKIGVRTKSNRILASRVNTLKSLVKNITSIGIFGMILISILARWGISVTPLITGAGIVGVAVAFGSQRFVHDVVTGFFILLENQYNVGDKVKVAGIEGKIVSINLRTTVLESNDGSMHFVPNSSISIVSKRPLEEDKK